MTSYDFGAGMDLTIASIQLCCSSLLVVSNTYILHLERTRIQQTS